MSNDIAVSKVFRVFISSTFSDFEDERNLLQREVFPRLEELCRERGALFQPVDLRWGITDEASLDQQTLDICLSEVRLCGEITPRPSFLILMGNRYGWIPIPASVPRADFEASDPTERMRDWYRLDENTDRYLLASRTGTYEDPAAWQEVEDALRHDWRERGFAQMSATEAEIRAGLDAPWENRQSIFCCARDLEGIPLTEEGARFADLVRKDAGYVLDEESTRHLDEQAVFIEERLPAENIICFEGAWAERPRLCCELCAAVEEHLRACIKAELDRLETIDVQAAALAAEQSYTESVSAHYVGNEALLDITVYNVKHGALPAIIIGDEGKSAFAAALAKRIELDRECWNKRVILRHVGVSTLASDVTTLLESIALQLGLDAPGMSSALDEELKRHGFDYSERLVRLQEMLRNRLAQGDVVLIIDGVEKLPGVAAALSPLVTNALVLTTADYDVVRALESVSVDELAPLSDEDKRSVFEWQLSEGAHRLSGYQRAVLYRAVGNNPSVSFAKLAGTYARQLASWDEPAEFATERELAAVLRRVLVEEKKHADLLVRRMFAYLSLGRNGITLPDLMGMLQRDRQVFDEFNRGLYHELARPEIPPSILSRLYYDLAPFLAHRPFLGADQVSFAYKGFAQEALESCVDADAVENAIAYYEERGATSDAAVLSELPFLLRTHRGAESYLRWVSTEGHLGRVLEAGLAFELMADAAVLDDTPAVRAFRAILANRIDDVRRRPEAAQAILQSEAEALRAGEDAEALADLVGSVPLGMLGTTTSAIPTPAYRLGRGINWVHCSFNLWEEGKLLAVQQTGQVSLFDFERGGYTSSVMPGEWTDRFMYASADGDDAIVVMGEDEAFRLEAPGFWERGLTSAVWVDEEVDGTSLQAMSSAYNLTYAQKLACGGLELVQRHTGEDDDSDEHIPIDFLMRPSEVNDIAVSYTHEIAVAFRSGAIAATGGLLQETISDDALMCCCFYGTKEDKVAAMSSAGMLYLFDMRGDCLLEKIDLSIPGVIEQHGECICWDDEHELLFVGHRSGYLSVVRPGAGRRGVRQVPSGFKLGILSIAVSADGRWLALGERGNMGEAQLNLYDVERLLAEIDELGRMRQLFDKEVTNALLAGERWYFCSENEGWKDSKIRLFSAPLEEPAAAEFLVAADVYAPAPARGAVFFSRDGQFKALVDGRELDLGELPHEASGMAIDNEQRLLAVCAGSALFLLDISGFAMSAGEDHGIRQLWDIELPIARGRLNAPMRFDGGGLLICCEPRYATFTERDGHGTLDDVDRRLLAIDVERGELALEIPYHGFANGACLVEEGVLLTCGEGKAWTALANMQGATAFMRMDEGAGAYVFGEDGELVRMLTHESVAAVLHEDGETLLAYHTGDIRVFPADGDEVWCNVPGVPATLCVLGDEGSLLVLDDGSKSGGAPRAYSFGTGTGGVHYRRKESEEPSRTNAADIAARASETLSGMASEATEHREGVPEARIVYFMSSGKLTKEEIDRLIILNMMSVPEFRAGGGQAQAITEDGIPEQELAHPQRRLCHLIRNTNTQRYITDENALVFAKMSLTTGEDCYVALLFDGPLDDYPSALSYLGEHRGILGV